MSLEAVIKIVSRPNGGEEVLRAWSEQKTLTALLEDQRAGPWLILYASGFGSGSFLLHSILVPLADLQDVDDEGLTHWSGNPFDSWSCGLVLGGGQPPRVEFENPLRTIGSSTLSKGEQLVFGRSFEGRREDRRYFEIAQSLTHAHGLHWTPERHAWCRLDENGDVENVIEWTEGGGGGGQRAATCIAIKRDVLEMQMSARDMALVQMFDSTCVPERFRSWGTGADSAVHDAKTGLYYRSHVEGLNGSYFRGVQVIRPQRSAHELGAYLEECQNRPKQYESFITQDWKNRRITVVSCDPAHIASYFEKDSPLPFHTSPVLFNPAVLDKYRADPEKYSLEHRSISCRNSWHLSTYDVNEAGQVHTYIKYLGDLPHSEQVYWKAFNEEPKAPISRRAYMTDFEGEFDQEPDSLRDLQSLLQALNRDGVPWFNLREPDLLDQVHYPLTDSTKTWGETLETLAKLVNEGLVQKFFEAKARGLGATGESTWRSIKWAEESLRRMGLEEDVVDAVISPLRNLQHLRTKLGSAHSSGNETNAIRADLLRRHDSPRNHIEHIAAEVVQSLRMLRDLNR